MRGRGGGQAEEDDLLLCHNPVFTACGRGVFQGWVSVASGTAAGESCQVC